MKQYVNYCFIAKGALKELNTARLAKKLTLETPKERGRNWRGLTKPPTWHVSVVHGSYPGPQQCSLASALDEI
jgi:hypothetical protein